MCRTDHPEGDYQVELRLFRQESGRLVYTEKLRGRQPYEAILRASLKALEVYMQADNLELKLCSTVLCRLWRHPPLTVKGEPRVPSTGR